MEILISGAYGFVGTNLCNYLNEQGHHCSALDIKKGLAPYGTFYTWDKLKNIPWEKIDAIVHLAGMAHDTKNTADPQRYFDINCGLTEKLFMACRQKVKRFIFFSSVKACADSVEGFLTEGTVCSPITPYGKSKLKAELFLLEQKTTTEIFILRPAMIYGPGNKGNLNLLYGVTKHGIPWPLGAFENRRSFTSIVNICTVVEALCTGTVSPDIYQVADDETLSVNRLIELIAESVGKQSHILKIPPRVMRFVAKVGDAFRLPLNSERLKKLTESYMVSNKKLRNALGWEHMPVRAEDGMRETFFSFR